MITMSELDGEAFIDFLVLQEGGKKAVDSKVPYIFIDGLKIYYTYYLERRSADKFDFTCSNEEFLLSKEYIFRKDDWYE